MKGSTNNNVIDLNVSVAMKPSCALILYFEHDEDRDFFMDMMEESDPTMVMRPMDRDEMV